MLSKHLAMACTILQSYIRSNETLICTYPQPVHMLHAGYVLPAQDRQSVYLVLELCTGGLLSGLQHEEQIGKALGAAFPRYAPVPEPHVAWTVQ